MFDPTKPNEVTYLEESVANAQYIFDFCTNRFDDFPQAFGAMVIATSAMSKACQVDLHTLMGAVMTSYKLAKVETHEEDDHEGPGE